MKLTKLIKYLDKKFPSSKAYEWDNVGIQKFNRKVVDLDKEILNVLITMDLNKMSLDKIKNNKIDFIITRHPFIFNDLNKEKENPFKKELIKFLTKQNIYVFSIHTNYDICGYNAFVEELSKQFSIKKAKFPLLHKEYLEVNLSKEITNNELIESLKKIFNTKTIQINNNDQFKTSKFFINQGSGASSIVSKQIKDSVFITGEAKWSDWIYANDNNVTLIVAGHYMENYFINDIEARLSNNFKDLKIEKIDIKEQYYVK
ncbi:dinuclear metal center protein, YbgI family [Mesoplasma entomophilum]|uniref:Nif3-like dinuclear metal center hexameric protein n=1 Tax=Mesoplasma entomophilum TaxID=2149 RepID=UPI000D03809E|nr:Nif3-like dinuclear metal center hexameric protein [Mesoplasma entomophilum]AVN60289.1 dinuclear metal center protein, YbgI family [Mesoplasma entomophilum]